MALLPRIRSRIDPILGPVLALLRPLKVFRLVRSLLVAVPIAALPTDDVAVTVPVPTSQPGVVTASEVMRPGQSDSDPAASGVGRAPGS